MAFFSKIRNDEDFDNYSESDVATARADSGATAGSKVFTFNASTTLHLVVNRPKKYSDAAEIAELYKNKTTVILMFNNTNKDIANRLIDFLGGVSYITDGELKRIGDTTYVLAPYNVDISGDFIEEINNISGSDDIFDTLD
ncbi:MAG: cell division protein SepF [Ruminiclostridium sp.]|nr:cell division protein SepF [Ruminiclostridium sp.]